MRARRLTPPNEVAMPSAISGPMPLGDAQDPPVSQIALEAARRINDLCALQPGAVRTARIQLAIEAAIGETLDRCQELGGRRVR